MATTVEKLYQLVQELCINLRKTAPATINGQPATGNEAVAHLEAFLDEQRKGPGGIIEIWDMPGVKALKDHTDFSFIDVHYFIVAVDKSKADAKKDQFVALIEEYNRNPNEGVRLSAQEASYMLIGGALGDQEFALQVMALGEYYGLWLVLTPKRVLGDMIDDETAERMAGAGFVTTGRTDGFLGLPTNVLEE